MREFQIIFDEPNFINDFNETVRSFYPHATISESGEPIILSYKLVKNSLESCVKIGQKSYTRRDIVENFDEIILKRHKKRYLKLLLYKALSDTLSVVLPWGSLTGIRPTKLAYELKTAVDMDTVDVLINQFYVSEERAKLVSTVMSQQEGIYSTNVTDVDLYINIPFCVSRCTYCSFVSALTNDKKKLLLPYSKSLHKEVDCALNMIKSHGYNLRAIYCGGGTPTSLSKDLLEVIFDGLDIPNVEFTVECGRPDTINEEKLSYLASIGVNRISINPQTFNQAVLDIIGRKHSVDDIYSAFSLARKFPFKINMDLIADLPGDTTQSFLNSVEECIKLNPENITVHTLSIKHSSKMQEDNYDNRLKASNSLIDAVDKSRKNLITAGYYPYYLYRQKNTSGNLENIGYAKSGTQCVYNVDIMEETTSIVSCGAGGISKRVFSERGRIERQNIVKNIEQYLREVDEIIAKKEAFFR